MDFTTLPFEYEGRYASEYRDLGFSIEQGAWLEQRDRDLEDYLASLSPGGGGVPTLFAASANATAKSKAYADVVCSGTADDVDLNALLDEIGTDWGGRLFLSEGDFNITSPVTLGYGQSIQGLRDATFVQMGTSGGTAIQLYDFGFVRDLSITGSGGSGSIGVDVGTSYGTVEGCVIHSFETGIKVQAFHSNGSVLNNRFVGTGTTYAVDVAGDQTLVQGNYLNAELLVSAGSGALVLGNRFGSASAAVVTVGASASNACFSDNYMIGAGLSRFSDSGTDTQRGTNFSSSGSAW